MTVSQLNDRLTRLVAAALGVALVVALIVVARPASSHGGVLPASLSFTPSGDGAVEASPVAPRTVLADAHMRPGSHADGYLRLRNQTGARLAVRLRALPSSTALDGLAQVRVSAGGHQIFDSTLQLLRQGTAAIGLAPGTVVKVHIVASIPAETETGYEGRRVEVQLAPVEGIAR
ncbi:MAG TPA: hypothetical protein VLL27_05705 [Solirubrobacterales bacterium]|nr:hypothetical protein [Solirubrobacterales bacterium]